MNENQIDRRGVHRARLAALAAALFAAALTAMFVIACTSEGAPLFLGDDMPDSAPPVFGSAEGGADVEPGISYCATNQCPAGFTTCPDSRFPCDVDLKSDRANCGVCGSVCPSDGLGNIYACVEGRCVQKCDRVSRDCDGIVDNGCEIVPHMNDNCGECGVKCLDPAKPCVGQDGIPGVYACGCSNDGLYCPRGSPECVNPQTDDHNCGGCGNPCDPAGGDGLPPPFDDTVSYGCSRGECGHLKCTFGNGNCDGDMSNGCETRITTSPNCGGCGNVCPAGQDCRFDAMHNAFECKCPPGKTLCESGCNGDVCYGECRDLKTDAENCGACGVVCSGRYDPKSVASCSYGSCTRLCLTGWADCNGNTADSCEVNIQSDPQNCGGCGIACDVAVGQACVLGRCVVAPCDKDAGGTAR